jgi:hypothetical protein
MLEAVVSIRDRGPDSIKQQGDVILLALPGTPWSTAERRQFLIMEWEDPILESELRERKAKGEVLPTISYPYAEYALGEMIQRSTKKVDFIGMPIKDDLLNPNKEVPVQKLPKAAILERPRKVVQRA